MAVADTAGVESLGIGLGMALSAGIGPGHSLVLTKTYSLPLADTSDNAAEHAFEPSRLDQLQQHHHPLSQQPIHHQQLQVQQQQQIQDASRNGQQSKLMISSPASTKRLLSPRHHQQLSLANGVGSRVRAGQEDNAGMDTHSNVSNDSMRELEDLLTKLNPLAKEFVPPSHAELDSTALIAASSIKGSTRRVR
jgi:hypothetical protein